LELTVFLGPVEPSVDRVEHGHAPVSLSQRFTIATDAQFTQSLEHRAVGAAERLVIATRLAARGINSEVDLELV
jgi:DNA repair photolyase